MDQQIVNPGLNYNATISTGNLHFEWKKYTYIAAIQIIAKLQIIMLDDTVHLHKKVVQLW